MQGKHWRGNQAPLNPSPAMNPIIVLERSNTWLLRLPGQIFPILEADPEEVREYIRLNFTGRGTIEFHRANGAIERTHVSAFAAV
jgi:hypothetical protein